MLTLSQFLLGRLDRPPINIGPARAPKAKTTSFTLGRLFAVVLWRGFLGFLLGLALTRLFSTPWLAWPSGVMAGFAVSQALVVFGLGSLCWNQRAARLRASQAPAPASPLGIAAGFAAFVYVCVLWILTPLALLVTFENCRGEFAWRKERARLAAAGEKLTVREILGPEVPAAQNAGAAPIFTPVFDYTRAANSEAIQAFTHRVWLPRQNSSDNGVQPHTPGVNLRAWAECYRRTVANPLIEDPSWVAQIKLPAATNNSPGVVLAGLETISTGLSEIDAAARLPRAQFPVHYDDSFNALLPHLAVLKRASLALEVRCAARLSAGQTNLAAEDVGNALQVAELLREEPFLISQLVRYAQNAIAAGTLWQGLASHSWGEPQLAGWQNAFERIDFRQGCAAAFEGERVCAFSSLDALIGSRDIADLGNQFDGWSAFRAFGGAFFARGLVRQNEVALSRHSESVIRGIHHWNQTTPPGPLVDILPTFTAADGDFARRTAWFSPYTLILRMMAPSLGSAVVKMARAEAVTRMAALACGLERYRVAHGEYPESLAALSPGIITAIPTDPVNNQPFHYTKSNDGWFLLYSVGENGVDDGGIYRKGKAHDVLDWPWPVPSRPAQENLF